MFMTEIQVVKGIGSVRAAKYKKLGIESAEELIAFAPRSYENRGNILPLALAHEADRCSAVVTVATEARAARIGGGKHLLKFRVYDASGSAEILWFCRNVHAVPHFELGESYRMYGKYVKNRGKTECINPICEKVEKIENMRSLFPIYRTTDGLSSKQISGNIDAAFEVVGNNCSLFTEYLPRKVSEAASLMPLYDMYRELHKPTSLERIAEARRCAAYREFFTFFSMNILSRLSTVSAKKQPYGASAPVDFINSLPYKLTEGQLSALRDIKTDLNSDRLMRRIVVGDVGCGKTVVAEIAALMAVNCGYLTALMAPTEILATQHFLEFREIFGRYGMRVELLLGSTPKSERKRISFGLSKECPEEERIRVIIGTHALLSEKMEFQNLGLVLIDEQHRFGVSQRQRLVNKGDKVNSISFSATPIPRSYAKMLYGDVDASLIIDLPPGRPVPKTFVVYERHRAALDRLIEETAKEGHQVYVVCPKIELSEDTPEEESEYLTSLSVEEEYKRISSLFPQINVKMMHGKLKAEEKTEIMRVFSSGECKILVSTTVIEVGVNVPNTTLMVIIGAEHFGLAQLHQLRGRISRSKLQSRCYLCTQEKNAAASERLKLLERYSSGFDVAEADFKARGPGDLVSMTKSGNIRQSGEFAFKYAEFCDSVALMEQAHRDAEAFLSTEDGRNYAPLLEKIREVIKNALSE